MKRDIIRIVIISIMVLLNVVGTVTVLAFDITTGRDVIKECLYAISPVEERAAEPAPIDDWIIPTYATEPPATEETVVETEVIETVETNPTEIPEETTIPEESIFEEEVEPTVELTLENSVPEENIPNEIDENASESES